MTAWKDLVWKGLCQRHNDQSESFAIILQKLVEVWGQPAESVEEFRERIERYVIEPAKKMLIVPTPKKSRLLAHGVLGFDTLAEVESVIQEKTLPMVLKEARQGGPNAVDVQVATLRVYSCYGSVPEKKHKKQKVPKSLVVLAEGLTYSHHQPINAIFAITVGDDGKPTLLLNDNKKICIVYTIKEKPQGCDAVLLKDADTAIDQLFERCGFDNPPELGLDPTQTHLILRGLDSPLFGSTDDSNRTTWASLDALKLDDDCSNNCTIADFFAGFFKRA